MRRLLQLGTFFFVLTTILVPIAEFFDRWDAPGISNDTEFALFALVLVFCLVLIVSRLVAAVGLLKHLVTTALVRKPDRYLVEAVPVSARPTSAANLVPLRI